MARKRKLEQVFIHDQMVSITRKYRYNCPETDYGDRHGDMTNWEKATVDSGMGNNQLREPEREELLRKGRFQLHIDLSFGHGFIGSILELRWFFMHN